MISSPQAASELVCFSSEQIPIVWPSVKDHIERAVERVTTYTLDDVYEGLCDQRMQLWTSISGDVEAALVTSIETDHTKFCLLLAAGGANVDAWAPWIGTVEEWARGEGCTEMRIYGRIGWARKLNYRIDYTRLSKALWTHQTT